MKIVVDTSVFTDYSRIGKGPLAEIVKTEEDLYLPTIVIAELWAGKSMNGKDEKETVEEMIRGFKRIDLNIEIAKSTGELLRKGFMTGAADAIIAATALYLDARLATGNKKHFEKVKDLRFFA